MGRLFNSYYPVKLDTEANANIMAAKIAEISNGKLSVYSVPAAGVIYLQYLNTNLILEISKSGSDLFGYFGSMGTGSYSHVSTVSSRFNGAANGNLRVCYSEIDDTLCCLTVMGSGYIGSLATPNYMLNFTIANTIINNTQYLTCAGTGGSNSFFGVGSSGSYVAHFTMSGNYLGTTGPGCINIISLYELHSNVYYTGAGLLIPYYFIADAANHTLMGEIQFSGQNGKRLYALLPPTSNGLVDPRENYIINGTSYKACGDIIKPFL